MDLETFSKYRYEKKFFINKLDSKEVISIIRNIPFHVREIFEERIVNNIYFDSADFSNYYSNEQGLSNRFKFRIRWYGKTFGEIKNPRLEVKIKNNELGRKLNFDLKSFQLKKGFSKEDILNVIKVSKIPLHISEMLRRSYPTLLNSYKRRYFISSDNKYRITVDRDLGFCNIHEGKNNFVERYKNREDIIVEIKYSIEDHSALGDFLRYFPFRLSTCSKYVLGIDSINRESSSY